MHHHRHDPACQLCAKVEKLFEELRVPAVQATAVGARLHCLISRDVDSTQRVGGALRGSCALCDRQAFGSKHTSLLSFLQCKHGLGPLFFKVGSGQGSFVGLAQPAWCPGPAGPQTRSGLFSFSLFSRVAGRLGRGPQAAREKLGGFSKCAEAELANEGRV